MNEFIFLFFVLGLIIGSFLNVVVYRLKESETFLGRSFCRQCKHQIRFYDNIPLLSYLLLRGKCRDCGAKISWQYPLVELLTGILFALIAYYFFLNQEQVVWMEIVWLLGIVSILVSIAAYDLRFMEIPLSLLIAGALFTALFFLLTFDKSELWWGNSLSYAIFGGSVVALFFFALVFASKETWMGWGDVWLGGIAGMIVGLPLVLFMLTLSFGIGAIFGIAALALGKKQMKSQVPFAPFLVIGTLLSLFLPHMFPEYMRLFLL